MAYACPRCSRQFDVTLFEFGRAVRCDCGHVVDIHQGHRRDISYYHRWRPPRTAARRRRRGPGRRRPEAG